MSKNSRSHSKPMRDPLLGTFATLRKNPQSAVRSLKTDRSYRQAKIIINKLRPLGLDSSIYPKNNVSIWNDVLTIPAYPKSSDWIEELGWLSHSFCLHSAAIKSFHSLRNDFWNAYLLGDYDCASAILDKVEAEHGLSLWLAERRFMLLQSMKGFEGHKEKLSVIQKEITYSMASFLVTMLSNRSEPHVTHDAFLMSIQRNLHSMRKDGLQIYASLVEIQLYPWSYGWLVNGHEMLWWCIGKPLVDRYDRSIKVASLLASKTISDDQRQRLLNIVIDLEASIPDRQLRYLRISLEPLSQITFDPKSEAYYAAVDNLVEGNYFEAAQQAESLVKDDPTCFDFYWLMAAAAACYDESYKHTLNEGSLACNIFDNLLQIAENRVDVNIALIAIENIALKLGDTYLGISLWQLVQREGYGVINVDARNQAFIQSKVDSLDLLAALDVGSSTSCLIQLEKTYGRHVCFGWAFYKDMCESDVDLCTNTMAPSFSAVTKAKKAALNNQHESVLSQLSRVRESEYKINEVRFQIGEIAKLEFDSLMALHRPEEAAAAVLKFYIRNPNILRNVPFEQLIEGANNGKWVELKRQIYWPILVYLNNGDAQDIYEAVDDLLIAHGLVSPLDISSGKLPCSDQELRIILRDVLIPSVIARGGLWFKTAEDRRTLRTTFLQRLFALSVEDQAAVVEEISTIEQAKLLEAAYRNVEGPKFYLDYVDVNRALALLLQGFFERYIEHRDYEEKGGQLATDSDLLELAKAGAKFKSTNDRRSETSDLLMRHMSIDIFIQYLWGTQKGIHAVLSTRIRHGALENQLKRVFGAHSLLVTRGIDGSYKCDEQLSGCLQGCNIETRTALEQSYVKFTGEISTIFDALMATHLKIKIPDIIIAVVEQQGLPSKELSDSDGVLDFSNLFSDQTLAKLKSSQPSSVSALLLEAQRIFVDTVRVAFANVRTFIEINVGRHIQAAIDELDNNIKCTLDDGPLRVLLRGEILAAKDEFWQDLKIIQNWFSIAEQLDSGVGTFDELVTTTWRVIDFASNGRLGKITKLNFDNQALAPSESVVMYEVLSILLRNVVQHSDIQIDQEIECEHIIDTNHRKLVVRNKVKDHELCSKCVAQATHSISKPPDERVLDRLPGGTGLDRIRTLLKNADMNVELAFTCRTSPSRFEVQIIY